MSWGPETSARFQALRKREEAGTLTSAERDELQVLVAQLEAEEAAYLEPATHRLREERLRTEAQNAALEGLVHREERLVRRLEEFLVEARSERRAIEEERGRILQSGIPASARR